jgi:arsenite methyltransferase
MSEKPDYGIDAPYAIRNLILSGVAVAVFCVLVPRLRIGHVELIFFPSLLVSAAFLITPGVLMWIYSKYGKFHHRDRILACIPWTGKERVLDVGTGRGLLLAGAAKHLTTGKATGIDIWNQEDLSGNNLQNLQRNLEDEGVREKTEVLNEDAQKMSFPDATFDAVVSNLCLHNIYNRPGRAQACREIARVLKPGGIAVISDFRHTKEYKDVFAKLGMKIQNRPLTLDTFPPLRIFTATKPAN